MVRYVQASISEGLGATGFSVYCADYLTWRKIIQLITKLTLNYRVHFHYYM